MSSLTMAQATTYLSTIEDLKEIAKRQARLVVKVIASLDVYALDGQQPISFYDSSAFASVAYLLMHLLDLFSSVKVLDLTSSV